MHDLSWQESAVCASVGADIFHPELGQNDLIAGAKRICASCPVRVECLEYAMAVEGPLEVVRYGVWGGLSARERAALARKRRRQSAA